MKRQNLVSTKKRWSNTNFGKLFLITGTMYEDAMHNIWLDWSFSAIFDFGVDQSFFYFVFEKAFQIEVDTTNEDLKT